MPTTRSQARKDKLTGLQKLQSLMRKRVQELGTALQGFWPSEFSEFAPDIETAKLVSDYYCYGVPFVDDKPDVELLIICESPIRTKPGWHNATIDPSFLQKGQVLDGYDGPTNYASLVHSFGYGEAWLLDKDTMTNDMSNDLGKVKRGTPMFWKVKSVLAGNCDSFDPDVLSEDEFNFTTAFGDAGTGGHKDAQLQHDRVKAKFDIVKAMKNRRIALVDTSPYPISLSSEKVERENKTTGEFYTDPKYKLKDSVKKRIFRESFSHYTKEFIEQVKPKQVIVLGKGIFDAIGEELSTIVTSYGGSFLGTLNHPSYNRTTGSKYLPYFRLLRQYALDCESKRNQAADTDPMDTSP